MNQKEIKEARDQRIKDAIRDFERNAVRPRICDLCGERVERGNLCRVCRAKFRERPVRK